ncbi:AzlD domain-containing protein [Bacteroides fragilis]|nr:AzlD domain-containing protein [Bacteroides fragilis]MCS2376972.1 AzlD domain-containing protein [Bacteroides fragilis]MCS3112085.1 AzlD domain-containing protein [Bacteroides fragilis]
MLVVYCYKDVDFLTPSYGISEIISGICVIIIQMLFKNMAYSILLGSGLYILLVN